MATAASLKVTKRFTYRGADQLFSNRYHFIGDVPTDDAGWLSLGNSIAEQEQHLFTSGVTVVRIDATPAGTDVPVWTNNYSLAGDASFFDAQNVPGDVAGLVRYSTNVRTTKNHPKYGMNYYHGVLKSGGGDADTWLEAQRDLFDGYAADWVSGQTWSGGSVTRSLPGGASTISHLVEEFLTHRDFPR